MLQFPLVGGGVARYAGLEPQGERTMRGFRELCALGGLLAASSAFGQMTPAPPPPPGGVAVEVQRGYATVKPNILKAADKMPADAFQYKPEPDIRTFARIVNHVIEAQNRTCAIASGMALSDVVKPPSDTADKATIVAALTASFALCDKAYAGVTDANAGELLTLGAAKRSHIGMLWGNVSHDNEQYAALALYMRLKGLTPPSSEK
jgi:hypothetical protein